MQNAAKKSNEMELQRVSTKQHRVYKYMHNFHLYCAFLIVIPIVTTVEIFSFQFFNSFLASSFFSACITSRLVRYFVYEAFNLPASYKIELFALLLKII